LQAYFKSEWTFERWYELAHWEFVEKSNTQGSWKNIHPTEAKSWALSFDTLKFHLELTKFKHVGIFPEQEANWRYMQQNTRPGQKILNLFAYTGAASLVARKKGAAVWHVDAVKQLITWANRNQELSSLEDIKWVLEDALKFALREVKRGNTYNGIVMDPPAFGLGAKGEKWILENQLPVLLETAHALLQPGAYLILNTYSPKVSLKDLQRIGSRYFEAKQLETFELWGKTKTGRDLYYGNLLRAKK